MKDRQILLEKLVSGLKAIDQSDCSTKIKCSKKINLCQELNLELRQQFFEDPIEIDRQVHFFKEIKPRFVSELHYQMELLKYLKEKPKGSIKAKKQFINMNMDRVSTYIASHCEFHHYIELESTHLDDHYFVMQPFDPGIHGSLELPLDPLFSSPGDSTLSCLICANRFLDFLKNELLTLQHPTLDPTWEQFKTLTWNHSKTDLVELIYALHANNAVNGELKDLVDVVERIFNLDLGNFYRTYTDIKYKKDQTAFLKELQQALHSRIRKDLLSD